MEIIILVSSQACSTINDFLGSVEIRKFNTGYTSNREVQLKMIKKQRSRRARVGELATWHNNYSLH